MAGDRLIHTIQNMSKPPIEETTDLLYGEVISITPLKIMVDNRFEVDEQFLILSALVKETIINISSHLHNGPSRVTASAGEHPHSHSVPAANTSSELPSIRLWRGLIVGDKVRLLRVANGQMFYVMERDGGVT